MTGEILVEVPNCSEMELPPPPGSGATWWERYRHFGLQGLSETATEVIEQDSRSIVRDCIPAPLEVGRWPDTRVRTGMVVGGVQSGKTASMLGISALLLDRGLDLLIILAGTRVALWRQTYERLLLQLDGSSPESAGDRWEARALVPQPLALLRGNRAPPATYMASAGGKIEDALIEHRPCIIVVPKQMQHLLAVSREIQKRLRGIEGRLDAPLHMVVLDDEADDASVLDAVDSKMIPRRIEMLWTGDGRTSTVSKRLFASYVAYTATPQANFLQQSHNPLAPRDFCAALRAPYSTGNVAVSPRSASYEEKEGIRSYYCGGDIFYREVPPNKDASLCRTLVYPDARNYPSPAEHAQRVRACADELLLEGLRAYLVAGAIRLLHAKRSGRFMPSEIAGGIPSDQKARLPPTHCMLVHPSAMQGIHMGEARRLVLLASGVDPDSPGAPLSLRPEELVLDIHALRKSLDSDRNSWKRWLDRYRETQRALGLLPGASDLFVPTPDDECALFDILREEVLPHVSIRIINSNPDSDDRPRFDPEPLADGNLGAPPDQMTIFISGNVMSRGITIEGLSTSVFTRQASEPAADTQMQMQRWFGYRGSHIHLCRVFCFQDQFELFRMYHEHDVALRTEILAGMDQGEAASPRFVLQGPRSLATAKVPTTRLPLHPGPTPSVKLLEADEEVAALHNARHLAQALDSGIWVPVGPTSKPRGLIREEPVSLLEAASLLEGLHFAAYDPDPLSDIRFTRWAVLEKQLSLLASEKPLFRPPALRRTQHIVDVRTCPYSIAAYLRLWDAALKRARCHGLFPSDSDSTPWALAQPLLRPPRFYVGVAFGDAGLSRWPQLRERGILTMTRGERPDTPRTANTLWGRRGTTGRYHGDQLFDYNLHELSPPRGTPLWRERGHPGLILFHVVKPSVGPFDAITVGAALPHGGPEQFAALPAQV